MNWQDVALVEAAIDWITVTTANPDSVKALHGVARKAMQQQQNLGNTEKKGGFQGYTGISTGPLFLGRRDDGWLFRASGRVADELYGWLPTHEVKCTRLDAQVTVATHRYEPTIAKHLADEREALPRPKGSELSPVQELRSRFGRGDILYIGARSSPRFARVYDKQEESGDPAYARSWRFEVEFKKMLAPKAWAAVRNHPQPGGEIAAIVKGQFAAWGIEVPVHGSGYVIPGSIGRREEDLERSLGWLRGQVRPSVERMLAKVSREELLEVLGLLGPDDELPVLRPALWTDKQYEHINQLDADDEIELRRAERARPSTHTWEPN